MPWFPGWREMLEENASVVVEGAFIALFDPDKYRTSDKEEREITRLIVVMDGARRPVSSVE